MNRQAEALHRRATDGACRRPASPHPHESAHLHVAGEAPYVDDMPELAGTLHAALGLSPMAHARIRSIDLDARARAARRGRGADRRRHPRARTIAARSSTTTRSSPTALVQYVGQPMFAVIAETRRRRAPRRARWRKVDYDRAAAPMLTPQRGASASSRTCCRRCTSRAATPRAAIAARAAPPAGRVLRRRPGAVLPRGADLATRCRRRTAACSSTARRSTRPRCSTWSRTRSGCVATRCTVEMPAHGRRLRRQGIAVGAVRLRRRASPRSSSAARSSCASTATTTS